MNIIKNKLKSLAPDLFTGTPVLFAYLYGSHAKGLPHPFSDLDIGIFIKEIGRRECLSLELSLALTLDKKLEHQTESDVRAINHLPLIIQGEIITSGVLIYCCNDTKRIDYETQVRMAYFDFLPVIGQYHRAFIIESLLQ